VSDPDAVATVLALLVEERRGRGSTGNPPYRSSGLSMLANETVGRPWCRPDARLNWLCHPETGFRPRVFAELVGGAGAGHFSVRPLRGGLPLGQRYVPGTMTVENAIFPKWLSRITWVHGLPSHRTDCDTRACPVSTPVEVSFSRHGPEFGQVGTRLRGGTGRPAG